MIRSKKHGIRPLIWVGLTTKQNTNSTPCPFCAGNVPVDEVICPHCQSAEETSLTRKLLKTPEIQIELPLETELYELEQSKTDTSMIMDAPERHGHIRDSDESREMRIVTKVRQPEFAAELAKRYIKDWRFVYDDDGVPVLFEIADMLSWVKEEHVGTVIDIFRSHATLREKYRRKIMDDDIKNSERTTQE